MENLKQPILMDLLGLGIGGMCLSDGRADADRLAGKFERLRSSPFKGDRNPNRQVRQVDAESKMPLFSCIEITC